MVTPGSIGSLQNHSTEAHNLTVPDGFPSLQDEFTRAPPLPSVSLYFYFTFIIYYSIILCIT